jgi:inosine-uridine nucleoside N-ribohydrolase
MNLLRIVVTGLVAAVGLGAALRPVAGQSPGAADVQAGKPELAILDTDIGDDIDDAFALALLLRSPEVKLLGITTAYGDTDLRAKLVDRFLCATGQGLGIPVIPGQPTSHSNVFTQAAYANQTFPCGGPAPGNLRERLGEQAHHDAVRFLLNEIGGNPGEITLIAIGPLTNVKAAIDRDAATFRKVKRVVMMGGSVYRGYGDEHQPPQPEWNIDRDPEAAKALFASGVPIFMMPLDSTQIHLAAADRERIFSFGSPITDQLTLLYHQWVAHTDNHAADPTLFDPVAAAYAIHPELCPMKPLRIEIDDKGNTLPVDGVPNAQVCLKSDETGFLDLLLKRVASPEQNPPR